MIDVTLYATVSLDGRIAAADGGFDWIAHDYSLDAFHAACRAADAVLVGRRAADAYGAAGMWPLPARRLIVWRRGPSDATAESMQGSPVDVLERLSETGCRSLLIAGGAQTATDFAAHGCLQHVRLDIQPAWLGHGLPLFANPPGPDLRLQLVDSQRQGPVTHAHYAVLR